MSTALCVVLVAGGAVFYVYLGYFLVLRVAVGLMPAPAKTRSEEPPSLTVLVTAFNEENLILGRIANILECSYDRSRMNVVVASDGSTDATDTLVASHPSPLVRLFRPAERGGKSLTQNAAIETMDSDIIVFTDANTRFSQDFLQAVTRPFADPHVGGVDGHLLFVQTATEGTVSQGQGFYWRQELCLREYESRIGTLAVASGACVAIRRSALRPIPAAVGEDCVLPLDVVRQGLRMVHARDAIAYDEMDRDATREFRTRVRMTLRNWQGTWFYPDLLSPLRHPGVAWSLWSHKLLRWLSPVFLAAWSAASAFVLFGDWRYRVLGIPGVAFALVLIAVCGVPPLRRTAVLRVVWAFGVANAGFLLGVVQALAGKRILTYR